MIRTVPEAFFRSDGHLPPPRRASRQRDIHEEHSAHRAEIAVGGIVDFTFLPVFNPKMEITALEEAKRVAWKCVGGHEPWQDNTFRFEIEARDKGSVLFFRHDYARELDDEEYGRYNFNWGYYLNSLQLLCETGTGKPYEA